MKTQTISYTITAHWLSAIFNGDLSGLDDGDEDMIRQFEARAIADAPEGYYLGHFASSDTRDEFGLCEISNLRGNVECIEAVYFEKAPMKLSLSNMRNSRLTKEEIAKIDSGNIFGWIKDGKMEFKHFKKWLEVKGIAA